MGRHAADGFSLIEMMVALAILSVVITQVLVLFSSQQATHTGQERALDAQEDAWLIVDLIARDARMAGFMIPANVGMASVDGDAANSDIFCVSNPDFIDDTVLEDAEERLDRASLASPVAGNANSLTVTAGHLDVDQDTDDDFAEDEGVILAGDTSTHCARIKNISGDTITFEPRTPGTFAAAALTGRAVPATIYEQGSGELRRNTLLLSNLVEDLQVEFGADLNDDGQIGGGEFPVHIVSAIDGSLIRGVQISALTRTAIDDPEFSGPGRQGVANRAGSGTRDGFRRRLVSTIVAPRNMQ